jgi:hypothetical protein
MTLFHQHVDSFTNEINMSFFNVSKIIVNESLCVGHVSIPFVSTTGSRLNSCLTLSFQLKKKILFHILFS